MEKCCVYVLCLKPLPCSTSNMRNWEPVLQFHYFINTKLNPLPAFRANNVSPARTKNNLLSAVLLVYWNWFMKYKTVDFLSGWQRLLYQKFPFSLVWILGKYRCRRVGAGVGGQSSIFWQAANRALLGAYFMLVSCLA